MPQKNADFSVSNDEACVFFRSRGNNFAAAGQPKGKLAADVLRKSAAQPLLKNVHKSRVGNT
jgi:hypothetical protein